MENQNLSNKDWALILESLNYSKQKFEEYDKYPSKEFKQERINEINLLISKVKSLIH